MPPTFHVESTMKIKGNIKKMATSGMSKSGPVFKIMRLCQLAHFQISSINLF